MTTMKLGTSISADFSFSSINHHGGPSLDTVTMASPIYSTCRGPCLGIYILTIASEPCNSNEVGKRRSVIFIDVI